MDFFNEYLKGKCFILYTDHKPLEKLGHQHSKMLKRLQMALLEHDFVKTLKDPPPEFDQFVADIKKDGKQVTQLCDSQELSLSKAKEISGR